MLLLLRKYFIFFFPIKFISQTIFYFMQNLPLICAFKSSRIELYGITHNFNQQYSLCYAIRFYSRSIRAVKYNAISISLFLSRTIHVFHKPPIFSKKIVANTSNKNVGRMERFPLQNAECRKRVTLGIRWGACEFFERRF